MESLASDKSYKAKRVRTSRKTNVASSSKKIVPEPVDDLFNELEDLVEEIKKEERLSQMQNQKNLIIEEKTTTSAGKSIEKVKPVEKLKEGKGRAKGKKKPEESIVQPDDSDFEVSKARKPKPSNPKPNKKLNESTNNDNSIVANAKGKKVKKHKGAEKSTPVKAADKSPKRVGSTDDQILEYLKSTNRPYSLINIFDNLKGKIKKPVIQKSLDDLAEKQLIDKKDFKKAAVYYYNQRSIPVDQQIIADAKRGLDEVKEKHSESAALNKELKSTLNTIEKEETTDNVRAIVEKLRKDVPALKHKLSVFKDKNAELVPEHVIDDKIKAVETLETLCRKRRKIFKTMFDTIQEQSGMKIDELYEELGIEPLPAPKN